MLQKRAKTKLACQIARVEPQHLNEAVSTRNYDCAPATTAGAARIFEVDDIIALRIYGLLVKFGVSVSMAGQCACEVLPLIRDPNVEAVSAVYTMAGHVFYLAAAASPEDWGLVNPSGAKPMVWTFDIAGLRREVIQHLDYESSILGDE